ncbi:uncharacterized protein [Drosophila bipectinata]|uniref:uncharacterized protein n=1 Tax=Drosophila bipectinata TaxID=42026 RepID=UPI001C8AFEA9|nr:uncharacterized protein LOC108134377 [Drosophila bipectinata]
MLTWKSLGDSMAGILFHPWASHRNGGPSSFKGHDVQSLGSFNHSQEEQVNPEYCCSLNWLVQLQQSSCPLIGLMVMGLLVLPLYNALLVLVGWRLNCTASSNAKRLIREIRRARPVKRQAPLPPLPPPRSRRRQAPKPPIQKQSVSESSSCSSQSNPYGSLQNNRKLADEYLRHNLSLALKGLQQPLPPPVPLRPSPLSEPEELSILEAPEPGGDSATHKSRSKLLAILKCSIFRPIWQKIRSRHSRKKLMNSVAHTVATSACSRDSICSSSTISSSRSNCLYVYYEQRGGWEAGEQLASSETSPSDATPAHI